MHKKYKIIEAVGITILLILSGLFVNVAAVHIQNINFSKATTTPLLYSQNIQNNRNQIENNNHPKNYDILIWRINKGKIDKEIVTIDYNTAMQIKTEYEIIETNTNNLVEQAEQKNNVLRKYNILDKDDSLENIVNKGKTGTHNRLYNLKNIFTNVDWPYPDFLLCMFSIFHATVHGNVSGINLGIPYQSTVAILHYAKAHGPAEGFALLFIIPNFLNIEEPKEIQIFMVFIVGVITYLPFIVNINNQGQFELTGITLEGVINLIE